MLFKLKVSILTKINKSWAINRGHVVVARPGSLGSLALWLSGSLALWVLWALWALWFSGLSGSLALWFSGSLALCVLATVEFCNSELKSTVYSESRKWQWSKVPEQVQITWAFAASTTLFCRLFD